jgi:hypothetical protein
LYEEFVEDADELKETTKGLINMYRSGRNAQTAINLAFHFLNKKNIVPEQITVEEARWIQEASQGALRFGEKYQGEAWKYDINSSYPSIYSSSKVHIPVKEGEFKRLTAKEFNDLETYSVGIYRATVEYPNNDKKYHKIFQQNSSNYYTHIELNFAKKKGFKIKIIEDSEPNFLYYSREKCLLGSQCFKEYVDLLYGLRRTNPNLNKRCKTLLTTLWGALCQHDECQIKIKLDEEFEVAEHNEIFKTEWNETHMTLTLIRKNKPFETNWARMKCFILAKGRVKIAEYIYPHMDHVKRCHTDSMVTDIKLPIKHSDKLGELKYEGYSKECIIKNSQQMQGIFSK